MNLRQEFGKLLKFGLEDAKAVWNRATKPTTQFTVSDKEDVLLDFSATETKFGRLVVNRKSLGEKCGKETKAKAGKRLLLEKGTKTLGIDNCSVSIAAKPV